jgi:hypothetical protein
MRSLGILTSALLLTGCQAAPAPAFNEAPLILTFADGVADSQVIPVEVNGTAAWLALDTGSAHTFLFRGQDDPEYVAEAGTVRIGTQTLTLPGYGAAGIGVEMFQGKPILGILGVDFFLPRGEIDYPGGRVVAWGDGAIPGAQNLPSIPLRVVEDLARVSVVMDGRTLDLMLDTGAHDTVLLGVDGQPGDEPAQVSTADGAISPVWIGASTVELPREAQRSVPVMRAREIDYISPWLVEEQGANGLLGMTSLGLRRLILDGDRLLLGPLP